VDYNKVYKARYLYKVAGVSDIAEITQQTGLSLEIARKAVDDSMNYYPSIKADFTADTVTGNYNRRYDVESKRLSAEKQHEAIERYTKLVVYEGKSLDYIKSLLLNDDVQDGQINRILAEVECKVSAHKAERLADIAEQLLAIEQLPSKWTVNKAMEVVEVFPSPLVDRNGHIYGVKYSSTPINWRKSLPVELAIALYEKEHPLYIDGHRISPLPDHWGPAEYAVLIQPGKRKRGFYQELADYLGMEYEELMPYLTRARGYLASVEKEPEAKPVDFKRIALIVAGLMADYKAKGGNVKKERKNAKKTAVTAE
jgi:hypothetical protein